MSVQKSLNLQNDRIDLSRHAALKKRTDGDVLVLPERAIRLGGSGGEILRQCEGGRTPQEVVERMQSRYPETPEIETEVRRFLAQMLELGGIVRVPDATEDVE